VPVYVHRQRVLAAQALLAAHPEVNVLLCDDGLQHYALGRDLEIAVIDLRLLGNGHVLPAGPLREPPARLAQTAVWALNGVSPGAVAALPGATQARYLPFQLLGANLQAVNPSKDVSNQSNPAPAWAQLQGRRVLVCAGIGAPERFFNSVAQFAQPHHIRASYHAFPDHHAYSEAAMRELVAQTQAEFVLGTEKDAVKWQAFAARFPVPMLMLPVHAEFNDVAQATLPACLLTLQENYRGRSPT
jgi:tetraacyldisaccharide 4'-kinase